MKLTRLCKLIRWSFLWPLNLPRHPALPDIPAEAPMTRSLAALLPAVLLPTLTLATGCDLLDQLNTHSGIVDVFATSHGTPDEEGNLPARNGQQLIFVNDLGWEIFVDEAYITTAGVSLQACAGDTFDVQMYWGPLAEDVGLTADSEHTGLGGVRVESGTFCEMIVDYAPVAEEVDNPEAVGATVFLTGSALKDGQHVDFVWRSEIAVEVEVDISTIDDGKPFEISDTQAVPDKLTVSKSYDRFFDGVDFGQEITQVDVDSRVADTLSNETNAREGAK